MKRLCQTLWIKSAEELRLFEYHFEQLISINVLLPTSEKVVRHSRQHQLSLITRYLILGFVGVGIVFGVGLTLKQRTPTATPTATPKDTNQPDLIFWTAIAYTKPSEAASELTATLKKAYQTDRADLIRLASLVETLAEPLAEFKPLLIDARKMRSFASGNQEAVEPPLVKNKFPKSLIFSGVALALVNVSFWYLYEPAKAIPMCMQSLVEPQGNDKALGIDVYDLSGTVDWTTVKNSGKTFAFAKATEGVSIKDSAFAEHWRTLKAVGMIRGAYHFFHPHTSDPVEQAKEFLKTVGKFEPGDLPPVLDIEVIDKGGNSQAVINGAKQWLAEVEKDLKQQTGRTIKPIIYTYPNFWEELGNPSDFDSYPLSIGRENQTQPPPTSIRSPWHGKYLLYQFATDISGVPGVSGKSDLNYFNGSVQDLKCFVKSPSLFQVTSQLRNLISGQKVTKTTEPFVSPTSTQVK